VACGSDPLPGFLADPTGSRYGEFLAVTGAYIALDPSEGCSPMAIARVRTIQYQTGHDDEIVSLYRNEIVPAAAEHPGLMQYLLLNDPETGKVLSITIWENEDAVPPGDPPHYVAGLAARLGELRDPSAGTPPQEMFNVSVNLRSGSTDETD
jgi:heme-degrading monooxygenase HmoA